MTERSVRCTVKVRVRKGSALGGWQWRCTACGDLSFRFDTHTYAMRSASCHAEGCPDIGWPEYPLED